MKQILVTTIEVRIALAQQLERLVTFPKSKSVGVATVAQCFTQAIATHMLCLIPSFIENYE